MCTRIDINFLTVDVSGTFKSSEAKLKNLHFRYQASKKSGRKFRQLLAPLASADQKEFSFVFKSCEHLQSFYLAQIDAISNENLALKEKISGLRQLQLENCVLKKEIASLKAARKNFVGRGPSKSHLVKHKHYSARQIRRKKRMLCEQFTEIAKASGLPVTDGLRSVEFACGSNKIEKFLPSGAQIEPEASQNGALTHQILLRKDKNLVANRVFGELSMILRENAAPCPSFYQIQKRIEELDSGLTLSKMAGQYFRMDKSFHQACQYTYKACCIWENFEVKVL